MKDFADLLRAIASLLWPILTFVFVIAFRGEITALAKRLKRGKFLGQEEFEELAPFLNVCAFTLQSGENAAGLCVLAVSSLSRLPSS